MRIICRIENWIIQKYINIQHIILCYLFEHIFYNEKIGNFDSNYINIYLYARYKYLLDLMKNDKYRYLCNVIMEEYENEHLDEILELESDNMMDFVRNKQIEIVQKIVNSLEYERSVFFNYTYNKDITEKEVQEGLMLMGKYWGCF